MSRMLRFLTAMLLASLAVTAQGIKHVNGTGTGSEVTINGVSGPDFVLTSDDIDYSAFPLSGLNYPVLESRMWTLSGLWDFSAGRFKPPASAFASIPTTALADGQLTYVNDTTATSPCLISSVLCMNKAGTLIGVGGGGTTVAANGPGYITVGGTDYIAPLMVQAYKPTTLTTTAGSVTVTTNANGSIYADFGSVSSGSIRSAVTTETTFIVGASVAQITGAGSGNSEFGIWARNTAGTPIGYACAIWGDATNNTFRTTINAVDADGAYSGSSGASVYAISLPTSTVFLKLVISATELKCSVLSGGDPSVSAHWKEIYNFSTTTFSGGIGAAGVEGGRAGALITYWRQL